MGAPERMVIGALVAAAATLAAAQPLSAQAVRSLRLDDYWRWQTASGARVSPDGKLVTFTRSAVNPKTDDEDSELWIMRADGTGARSLGKGYSVSWAPDGRLTYLAPGEKGVRFVARAVKGADPGGIGPEQEIRIDGPRPSGVAWSKDGTMVAFVASVPRQGREWPIPLAAPAGASWKSDPKIITELQYRVGVDQYRSSDRHIFVAPAGGGAARQLTSGTWDVGSVWSGIPFGSSLQWSADGKRIIFDGHTQHVETVADAQRSEINSVDVSTGALATLSRLPGFWGNPKLSPDGRLIAYAGNADLPGAFPPRQLRVMNVDGSGDRVLWNDPPDRIMQMEWAKDGRSILVSSNTQGATTLVAVALDGTRRTLAQGKYRFYLTGVAPGIGVGSIQTATHDAEIAAVDLRSGQLRTLTHVNPVLDEVRLGEVEDFWVRSADGTRVQAWLVKPADYDPAKTYPLILDIHGGPDAMAGYDFDFRHHEFAARGYLVLYANPRGSTGYGAAFANAIAGGFPGDKDAADLDAVVGSVLARGIVKRDQVYVMGCSGGGSLAAWMTARSRLFAASVVMCAVTDWISMAGTTDATSWAFSRITPPFWTDPRPWLEHSPLLQAGRIETPTLIAIGAQDQRTPVTQSAELYTALKVRGVPTRLLIFPDEGHGPWRSTPSNLLRLQLYIDEWFRTKGHPAAPAQTAGAPR